MSVEDGNGTQGSQEMGRDRFPELGTVSPVTDSDTSNQQPRRGLDSDNHLAVQETWQLPSPSPTPSPRSSSPSLVLTDSSGELTAAIPSRYSGSFEKSVSDSASGVKDESPLLSPLPISKSLPAHELHDIPEERVRKPRKLSAAKSNGEVLKLSAVEMEKLTSAPESLPVTSPVKSSPSLAASPVFERKASVSERKASVSERKASTSDAARSDSEDLRKGDRDYRPAVSEPLKISAPDSRDRRPSNEVTPTNISTSRRPGYSSSSRTISTPATASNRMSSYSKGSARPPSPRRKPVPSGDRPEPLDLNTTSKSLPNGSTDHPPSPIQPIPLPPMSIPTYLQLELSSSRPSPLYIYRSATDDTPYESSKLKFERLLNFLLLPPQLEQVLYFGSLACLDAWLYTFTILPLRFFKAAAVLIQWWFEIIAREVRFVLGFIYHGAGRFWHRHRDQRSSTDSSSRSRSVSRVRRPTASTASSFQSQAGRSSESSNSNGTHEHFRIESERKSRQGWGRKHRRTKSQPSLLSSNHKADLLQGAVIIFSCILLMKLDASRMYHNIRGQSAIKLYVIYNALEVSHLHFSCASH